jgi:hypothetical protein
MTLEEVKASGLGLQAISGILDDSVSLFFAYVNFSQNIIQD